MKVLVTILLLSIAQMGIAQSLLQDPLGPDRIFVNPALKPFYHGVASGDPLSDRVILWTRVTPDATVQGSINVTWEIALDTLFTQIINSGTTSTHLGRDWTVKVDATGLQPNTYYYYRFNALSTPSLIGRTKTAPVANVDTLRYAVVSCSNFEVGYFHAYEHIAQRNDVDAVLHLGDYIYEYGATSILPDRTHSPEKEILNLIDYRMRHSQHKLDPDLRYVHQQYPFVCVWDDHEVANDAWKDGAENHAPATEGNWSDRKYAATRAYFEWMPIRLPDQTDSTRIFRSLNFGNLAQVIMMDTRHYAREEQTSSVNNDTTRTILGSNQLAWLKNELKSNAKWKLLGQQVMVAPLKIFGFPINLDQWDGYPAERQKIYDYILNQNIEDVVVLTGDIHSSWANDLPYNNQYDPQTGANSVAVEFVTTSVTTTNSPITVSQAIIQAANSHVKYSDLSQHGYLILDVNAQRVQGDWYYVSSVTDSAYTTAFAEGWYVNEGERFLRKAQNASVPSSIVTQPQAPIIVGYENGVSIDAPQHVLSLLATYPNPVTANFVVEYHLQKSSEVSLLLSDMSGKVLRTIAIGSRPKGLHALKVQTDDLPIGQYFLTLSANGNIGNKVILKVE